MAQEFVNTDEIVVGEQIEHVRLITLNRPRQLNVISSKVVSLLAEHLEKWEKDDNAELVIIKGSGGAFSAGGDLKMFYDSTKSSITEEIVLIRWLWFTEFQWVWRRIFDGEFLALTGARLNGKELVAAGLATHFVPLEKISVLEKRLISLKLRK
ncbi:3-hydroxyisobutyryl-CoA hydrolase-like protein 5 isoform X2 [Malus sylvestris]|uniref:3-hydroxyisobutyryl-CoA hydrolase-like protein 5 isoform X2 n=1 Tax=Malus sylvestris TaxID=3752 RepID=UPI0021AC3211|nr:3-hydroxyisobutyryl-CoA hydrolase-like protein 5 isoform X2 [Malus sylvestris]